MKEIKVIALKESDLSNVTSLVSAIKEIHQLAHYGITKSCSVETIFWNACLDSGIKPSEESLSKIRENQQILDKYFRDIQHIGMAITFALEDGREIQTFDTSWNGLESIKEA